MPITLEKGIYQLGGQSILFPNDALDKKEDLRDVCECLNNWVDTVIMRHRDIQLIKTLIHHFTAMKKFPKK